MDEFNIQMENQSLELKELKIKSKKNTKRLRNIKNSIAKLTGKEIKTKIENI